MNNPMNGLQQAQSQQPQVTVDARNVPVLFSVDQWNGILQVLSKAPWETAAPLIPEIHRQVGEVMEARRQQAQAQGQEISRPGPGALG